MLESICKSGRLCMSITERHGSVSQLTVTQLNWRGLVAVLMEKEVGYRYKDLAKWAFQSLNLSTLVS